MLLLQFIFEPPTSNTILVAKNVTTTVAVEKIFGESISCKSDDDDVKTRNPDNIDKIIFGKKTKKTFLVKEESFLEPREKFEFFFFWWKLKASRGLAALQPRAAEYVCNDVKRKKIQLSPEE